MTFVYRATTCIGHLRVPRLTRAQESGIVRVADISRYAIHFLDGTPKHARTYRSLPSARLAHRHHGARMRLDLVPCRRVREAWQRLDCSEACVRRRAARERIGARLFSTPIPGAGRERRAVGHKRADLLFARRGGLGGGRVAGGQGEQQGDGVAHARRYAFTSGLILGDCNA